MPRNPRIKGQSGVYHVMLRSVNRQQIFFEEDDYRFFIRLLKRYKAVSDYKLYAYCLMSNHIHLLIQAYDEDISTILKRIGTAFAFWYNGKYDRVGHIFQDRFKSEPVDTQHYLLTVLRYILRNPVAAGICHSPQEYTYSNALVYFGHPDHLTDLDFIYSLIDANSLQQFILQENEDRCLEMSPAARKQIADADALTLIRKEFGTLTPFIGLKKERASFNNSVTKLLHAGISIRQLSRLTGISKGILQDVNKSSLVSESNSSFLK